MIKPKKHNNASKSKSFFQENENLILIITSLFLIVIMVCIVGAGISYKNSKTSKQAGNELQNRGVNEDNLKEENSVSTDSPNTNSTNPSSPNSKKSSNSASTAPSSTTTPVAQCDEARKAGAIIARDTKLAESQAILDARVAEINSLYGGSDPSNYNNDQYQKSFAISTAMSEFYARNNSANAEYTQLLRSINC